jgi:hypothetical protein
MAAAPPEAPLSDASAACIACHSIATPGVVGGWRLSRHSHTTPAAGMARRPLERRISATSVPDKLRDVAVGCYECHGLNTADHQDHFEHFGFTINVVVSPKDCATCHPVEQQQFAESKKAYALDNLERNPLFQLLVDTATSGQMVRAGHLTATGATPNSRNEGCYNCHGTRIEVQGMRTVNAGDVEVTVPKLKGWPNNGVGRINPDGSRGSCASCHSRHSFSIAVARQPYTCAQCHLMPDVPAWEVYKESKHGNLFQSVGNKWDFDHVPWRVGRDMEAPTCATCHNSLLVGGDDDDPQVVAPRTHDFGSRLWVRIFGLPQSHPQPVHGRTWELRNADGQPLPMTFDGRLAAAGLIDPAEQAKRRLAMVRLCASCHSTSWAEGYFDKMDTTVKEVDGMVKASTDLLQIAYQHKLADPTNPFDEEIEQRVGEQWLFYANAARYGAAMMGPDYTGFEGWWRMQHNVSSITDWLELRGVKNLRK